MRQVTVGGFTTIFLLSVAQNYRCPYLRPDLFQKAATKTFKTVDLVRLKKAYLDSLVSLLEREY